MGDSSGKPTVEGRYPRAVLERAFATRPLLRSLAWRAGWVARYGPRALPAYVPRNIPSLLADEEEIALYSLARSLGPGAQVAEIGAWIGRSSVILAKAIRRSRGARVWAVDPFLGAEIGIEDAEATEEFARILCGLQSTQRAAFERNISRMGVGDVVQAVEGYSHEVARDWQTPLDLLFVDADHAYEAVHRDIAAWMPHLKVGGWIAMHDVFLHSDGEYVGPGRVARESILDQPGWRDVSITRSLLLARRVI